MHFVDVRVEADLQIQQDSLGAAFVGYMLGPVSILNCTFTGILTEPKTAAGAFVGIAKNGSLTVKDSSVLGFIRGVERTLKKPTEVPAEYTAMGSFFGILYTHAEISSSIANGSISDVYVTTDDSGF